MATKFLSVREHWQGESNDTCVESAAEHVACAGKRQVLLAMPEGLVACASSVDVQNVVETVALDEPENPDSQDGNSCRDEDRVKELSPAIWESEGCEVGQDIER